MTRIEVVTHDLLTGCTEVDRKWDVPTKANPSTARHEAEQYAASLCAQDKSTDHATYVRVSEVEGDE